MLATLPQNRKDLKKVLAGKLGGRPLGSIGTVEAIAREHKLRLAELVHKSFDKIINAQIAKAVDGDTQAYIALSDRYQGKPAQQVDLTSSTGQVVVFMPPELLAKHTIEQAAPVEVLSNIKVK